VQFKICSVCKIEKPIDNFYKIKNTTHCRNECKICNNARHKLWRKNNPEKFKASVLKSRPKKLEYLKAYCKTEQYKQKNKIYRDKNKEKLAETSKAWFKKNPDRARNHKLKSDYNITLEDYKIMFSNQNGCCAICNTKQSDLLKTLAVDHCHTTGQVRGLLCDKCNRGLGFFNDNTEILKVAINYLAKSRS